MRQLGKSLIALIPLIVGLAAELVKLLVGLAQKTDDNPRDEGRGSDELPPSP